MNINERIESLEEELKVLKEEASKPYKIEFVKDKTYIIGLYYVSSECNGKDKDYNNHGRYRKTEEGAELSLERNKKANRLEMLVESLNGLTEFNKNQNNYYVYYDDKWDYSYTNDLFCPERVYILTKEIAREVCELLNSGKYKL